MFHSILAKNAIHSSHKRVAFFARMQYNLRTFGCKVSII